MLYNIYKKFLATGTAKSAIRRSNGGVAVRASRKHFGAVIGAVAFAGGTRHRALALWAEVIVEGFGGFHNDSLGDARLDASQK